jgi:hypothetical protein
VFPVYRFSLAHAPRCLICRFASASPPSRPAALGSIFVRAILVPGGALPNGPLGKGCSRHCAPESTRNDGNWRFIDVSPMPLHRIVHGRTIFGCVFASWTSPLCGEPLY